MKPAFCILSFFLSCSLLSAQSIQRQPSARLRQAPPPASLSSIQIQQTSEVSSLVQRLFGSSCTVSNVTLRGAAHATGLFEGADTILNLNQGIVLCTGPVEELIGPNDDFENDELGFDGTDADLAGLYPGAQFDLVSLEFDISTDQDTLTFDYVFGTEDHCEFINFTNYVDQFGIFVSGPGISGTVNISNTPTSPSFPVNVVTINYQNNSNLYFNNNQTFNCSDLPAPFFDVFELNGWTVPLKAQIAVQPCTQYHVKIALADGEDRYFSSAVFLKSQPPPASNDVTVEMIYNNPQGVLLEGCPDGGIIRFSRVNQDTTQDLTVNIAAGGSATAGLDYTPALGNQITIPAGQFFVEIPVFALQDGLVEPEEQLQIDLSTSCACLGIALRIQDQPAISVSLNSANLPANGVVTLTANVVNGLPPLTYLWSNGQTSSSIIVSSTGQYSVTVSGQCGQSTSTAANVFQSNGSNTACEAAGISCNLSSIIGNSNVAPTGAGIACGLVSLQNVQWFAFVAGNTQIELELNSSDCEQGNGLQMALYDDCDAEDALVCNQGCVGCAGVPLDLSFDQFIPGNTYWLAIDGFAGDYCDFEVTVLSGASSAPLPDPITELSGPATVCAGNQAVFTADLPTGVGLYHWTAPAGSSINGLSNDEVFGTLQGASVTITFGDEGGQVCAQSGNSCSPFTEFKCVDIAVLTETPSLVIVGGELNCSSQNADIYCLVDSTVVQFSWEGPGGLTGTQPYLTVELPGVYSVTITNASGCTTSGSVEITADYATPVITLNAVNHPINNQSNGSIDIGISNVSAPYAVTWYYNGQFFGETEDLNGLQAGFYTCLVFAENSCSDTLYVTLENTTSAVRDLETTWLVSPNPSSGQFVLALGKAPVSNIDLQVFDNNGRVVWEKQSAVVGSEIHLDLSGLPNGGYYLKAANDREQQRIRLVIQR